MTQFSRIHLYIFTNNVMLGSWMYMSLRVLLCSHHVVIIIIIIIIIFRQPSSPSSLCHVVGRRPQHAVSKLACCPLPDRGAPLFVQVVSPPLGWSPFLSFLVVWPPCGDTRCSSIVFDAIDVPCPGSLCICCSRATIGISLRFLMI